MVIKMCKAGRVLAGRIDKAYLKTHGMFLSESKTNLSVPGVGRHRAKNFSQLIPNKLDILFSNLSKLGRAVVIRGL